MSHCVFLVLFANITFAICHNNKITIVCMLLFAVCVSSVCQRRQILWCFIACFSVLWYAPIPNNISIYFKFRSGNVLHSAWFLVSIIQKWLVFLCFMFRCDFRKQIFNSNTKWYDHFEDFSSTWRHIGDLSMKTNKKTTTTTKSIKQKHKQ